MYTVYRAVSLAALLFTTTAASDDLLITGDMGGIVEERIAMLTELQASNMRVVLDGHCASSCTLMLQERWDIEICATPNAWLYFHMPYGLNAANTNEMFIGDDQAERYEREWRELWLGTFNDKLNKILEMATEIGAVPNPSIDGDTSTTFDVHAIEVLPSCEPHSYMGRTK